MVSRFPQVFNPNGNDNFSELIWTDEVVEKSTGLANLNLNKHSYAIEWIKQAMSILWRPEEISMSEDKKQFDDLPKGIKDTFEYVISFLILLDSIVPNNTSTLLRVMADEEIKTALYWHTAIESLHRESYQYILKSVFGEDDKKINEVYYKFKHFEPLLKRNYAITRDFQALNDLVNRGIVDENNLNQLSYRQETLQRAVFRAMVNDLAIEGVVFFTGFNTFHIFAYKLGILQGSNQQITQIRKDEVLHIPLFTYILKEWRDRGYYYNEEEIKEIFGRSAEADIEFYTNSVAGEVPLMTEQNIKDYIQTLTNQRLALLGISPIFDVNRNPFEDIEKLLTQDKTSFFETGAIDYAHIPVSEEDIDKINFD